MCPSVAARRLRAPSRPTRFCKRITVRRGFFRRSFLARDLRAYLFERRNVREILRSRRSPFVLDESIETNDGAPNAITEIGVSPRRPRFFERDARDFREHVD